MIAMLRQRLSTANKEQPLSTKQLQGILDDLQYRWGEFTIEGFISWVAQLKGRSVDTLSFTASPNLFGAWVGTSAAEYFCYAEDVAGLSKTFVLAHEVSHWILLHATKRLTPQDLDRLLRGENIEVDDLQVVQQRSALGKKGWEDLEAERVAAMIVARAVMNQPPTIVDHTLKEYLNEWR